MEKVSEILSELKAQNRSVLTEFESKELLAEIGLPVPKQILVGEKDGEEAILHACQTIGYPVVLKLIAEDVVHKSDVGAVKLNIQGEDAAKKAISELFAIECTGEKKVSVQEMADEPITEIIIGTLQDPQFGPTIMFGIGGILVEVMKDVSFRIAPITDFDSEEMVHEIKGFTLLDGFRGKPKADLEAIKRALILIADLAYEHQEIAEMDLNPVFVYKSGIKVVDARIILKK